MGRAGDLVLGRVVRKVSACRKVAEVTWYMYTVLGMVASFRSSMKDL